MVFATYHRIRAKGESWAGTIPCLVQYVVCLHYGGIIWLSLQSALLLFLGYIRSWICSALTLSLYTIHCPHGGPTFSGYLVVCVILLMFLLGKLVSCCIQSFHWLCPLMIATGSLVMCIGGYRWLFHVVHVGYHNPYSIYFYEIFHHENIK